MTTNSLTDQLIKQGESSRVVFVPSLLDRGAIAESVCAFLNTHGGVVQVGLDENGVALGDASKAETDALDIYLRTEISPKVLFTVTLNPTESGPVVSVDVPAGSDRPYVYQGTVYVRDDSTNRSADHSELRAMVIGGTEQSSRWERRPALTLDVKDLDGRLVDETVRRAKQRNFDFTNPRNRKSIMQDLALQQNGQLTNAADVLFGREVWRRRPQTRLRAICYMSDRGDDFRDEQLFQGPASILLEDAVAFLRRHVAIRSEFHDGQLARESSSEYPFWSLREGVVNALVHRDYSKSSGSVSISVYPGRVEIFNSGKFPDGITPHHLNQAQHDSILINPDIAHVFFLQGLMERAGRGTYKMTQECDELGMRPPEWATTEAGVRLKFWGKAVTRDAQSESRTTVCQIRADSVVRCCQLLKEADALIDDLFDDRMAQRFSFYDRFAVFLSKTHADSVEDTLEQLVFGESEDALIGQVDSFEPTPQECMYLVAAARLRCIGLLWGLLPAERQKRADAPANKPADYDNSVSTRPEWLLDDGSFDEIKVQELNETFPERSSRYLLENWNFNCSWTTPEKAVLNAILNNYLPDVEIEDIPEEINGIRVRKLACLLRVATSCTLGRNVCPLEIRLRMKVDSWCDVRMTHLAPVDWIIDRIFDHGRNLVEFRATIPAIQRIPDPRDIMRLPIAYVDYAPGLQFLGNVIQDVLDSVQPCLVKCSNTFMGTVKVVSYHMGPKDTKSGEAFLPDHWALPLAAAVNASEAAGMTALILRSFCDFGFNDEPQPSFCEQVAEVCEAAEVLHPVNALIHRLVAEIQTRFQWDQEPNAEKKKDFREFLDGYLIRRADDGDRVADTALKSDILLDENGRELDLVVIYGYGRSVLSTLIKSRFRGEVIQVDVGHEVRGPWISQEAIRIAEILDTNQIQSRVVTLAGLYGTLRHAVAAGQTVGFLTGARCILEDGCNPKEFLCPTGTWQIAAAVNGSGGKTLAVAEKEKVVVDSREIELFRNRLTRLAAVMDKRPWAQVDPLKDQDHISVSVVD